MVEGEQIQPSRMTLEFGRNASGTAVFRSASPTAFNAGNMSTISLANCDIVGLGVFVDVPCGAGNQILAHVDWWNGGWNSTADVVLNAGVNANSITYPLGLYQVNIGDWLRVQQRCVGGNPGTGDSFTFYVEFEER
jgi:hypothetical protein